jgi:hypothetical protein
MVDKVPMPLPAPLPTDRLQITLKNLILFVFSLDLNLLSTPRQESSLGNKLLGKTQGESYPVPLSRNARHHHHFLQKSKE